MSKYQKQIDKLELIINNWDMIKNNSSRFVRIYTLEGYESFDLWAGLCANAWISRIQDKELVSMFSAWKHFSGTIWYPVGGFTEYHANRNKFATDLRLDLAKHCLKWLKENGGVS